jgi:tetratricopeptide (TPR) repeat protein
MRISMSQLPPRAPGLSGPPKPRASSGLRTRPGTPKRLRNPNLQKIADEIEANNLQTAERKLSEYLCTSPQDAEALMLMGRAAERRGNAAEAVSLLSRCLELAPDFADARFMRARLLSRLHRYAASLADLDQLPAKERRDRQSRELKADVLTKIGNDDGAREIYEGLIAEYPRQAESWVLYGGTFRARGDPGQGAAAYRKAIECRPSCGWAWWSLADVKGLRFTPADIRFMQAQLSRFDLSPEDRTYLLFALAKAHEDNHDYQQAFEHYVKANAFSQHRIKGEFSITTQVKRAKALFTAEFLARQAGCGCTSSGPIFVLGRPRSGSTLVEQILASHSAIEGTGELPYIGDLVQQLGNRQLHATGYPEVLENLDGTTLTGFGESYLESAAAHRRHNRPYFVDKRPANFLHVGLIHLILPNAKIIDVRRNPAAASLSMFKQDLGRTNLSLEGLGRAYRDYVELMAHFDRVLPGRIHRVIYEELIANPEAEIRNLLRYLGLPFEGNCLSHETTERAIRTPSSEQARQPIYDEAVDYWRNFERWLSPLTKSLGSVLTNYPAVPSELR